MDVLWILPVGDINDIYTVSARLHIAHSVGQIRYISRDIQSLQVKALVMVFYQCICILNVLDTGDRETLNVLRHKEQSIMERKGVPDVPRSVEACRVDGTRRGNIIYLDPVIETVVFRCKEIPALNLE